MKFGAILSAQALRRPDKAAVVCGDRRWTYRQLDERSNRLANALREKGLGLGDRAILYLDNSAEFADAFYGVIKAGGIAVPISTRLTRHELSFIVGDCSPKVIFFDPQRREAVDSAIREAGLSPAPLLVASRGAEPDVDGLVEAGDPAPLPALPAEFDDCLICYTSGTTGRPKGAIITHANNVVMHRLINAVEWGIGAEDSYLITTSLAHRAALGRMANACGLGGTLVIMDGFDPVTAVDTIEREKITVIGMVPTVARMLLPEIEKNPARCASLRIGLVTGEAFPVPVKQRLLELLPQLRLYSFFAMTESSGVTSLGPEEQFTHPTSVGRAMPGIEMKVVDEQGVEVPVGGIGELWVRSGLPGQYAVMRGYYNRPAETAASLRDGWFATGDLARVDEDGYFYIVDRKKDMILSGGLNIYSKEVEHALLSHGAVQDAAVIGMPDEFFGESVVACVELKPGRAASEADLIEHCRELIASYKKPKSVLFYPVLPRNTMGKVLKVQLRGELLKQ